MVSDTTKELEKLIQELQGEKAEHVAAIERIDATFARFGISAGAKARKTRGRPKGTVKSKQKRSGESVGGNPTFIAWADTFSSWPELAEKAGISYPTALGLRDGRTPRGPVRKKIEKASKGAVPADSWGS